MDQPSSMDGSTHPHGSRGSPSQLSRGGKPKGGEPHAKAKLGRSRPWPALSISLSCFQDFSLPSEHGQRAAASVRAWGGGSAFAQEQGHSSWASLDALFSCRMMVGVQETQVEKKNHRAAAPCYEASKFSQLKKEPKEGGRRCSPGTARLNMGKARWLGRPRQRRARANFMASL